MRLRETILLTLAALCGPQSLLADSFTAGGETYTYTEKQTQQLNSGVVHHRLRFTAPTSLNVQIVEVDLTNSNVRVETTLGSDKMFATQTLPNRYSALKSAGRKPLVIQNASFWSMSSQSTDAGQWATTCPLGGLMQNQTIVTETNYSSDTWVGGPTAQGVCGVGAGKAIAGHYQTYMRLMCPARWGTSETQNIITIEEVNRYCHNGRAAAFNANFPSDRDIKVINASTMPNTQMANGEGIYIFCSLKSGCHEGYNKWNKYIVKAITPNATSGYRGSYDLVLVGTQTAKTIMSTLQVGDEVQTKYYWHVTSGDVNVPIEGIDNVWAGHQVAMLNGTVQTPDGYGEDVYSRSAYGVSSDGKKMIMCVIDKSTDATYGTSNGCNTSRMSYIMQHWGASSVISCDAGGSAQMVINGSYVNTPSDQRGICASVVVYDEAQPDFPEDIEESDISTSGVTSYDASSVSGTSNPFCYNFSCTTSDEGVTFKWTNTAALNAATFRIISDDNATSLKTWTLADSYLTAGNKTFKLTWDEILDDAKGIVVGTKYSWGITAKCPAQAGVVKFKERKFYYPQTVETVNDTDDPYYGYIITAEGRTPKSSGYWSYSRGGQGVYLFTPRNLGSVTYINGTDTTYCFRQGLTDTNFTCDAGGTGSNNGSVPRKIRRTDDGRIFFTSESNYCAPLYEFPTLTKLITKNAKFTQVAGGPLDSSLWYWTDSDGNFSMAQNVGFDVKGEGDDLTLLMLGVDNNMLSSKSQTGVHCNTYKIGTATTWSGKTPTSTFSPYNKKILGTSYFANVEIDSKGNYWLCQSMTTPTAEKPSLICCSSSGTERFRNFSMVCGGGGIRFSPNGKQVVITSSETTFSVFDVTYSSGVPTLTEKYRVTHGLGTNVNDYAWDNAGNIYAVSTTNKKLAGFAMPREANTNITTKAREAYHFTAQAAPVVTTPTLSASVEEIELEAEVGESSKATFTLKGSDLTANATLSLSGTNKAMFAVSPTSVTAATSVSKTVTVTYTPTAASTHTATLTIASTGATSVSIPLTGIGTVTPEPEPDPDPDPTPSTFNDKVTGLDEIWLYSVTRGNVAESSEWLNTEPLQDYSRSLAFNDGKLYVVNNKTWSATPSINILNAYTGIKTGSLSVEGTTETSSTCRISDVQIFDGKLIASNRVTDSYTLKVYIWDNDASAPRELLSDATHASLSLGGQLAASGTLNDGYLWFTNGYSILRYKVTNGVASTDPETIALGKVCGGTNFTDGIFVESDGTFWVNGDKYAPTHFAADGSLLSRMELTALGGSHAAEATAVAAIPFGSRRYLAATTYGNTNESGLADGSLVLADITAGESDVTDAIGIYPSEGLGSNRNTNFITSVAYETTTDGKLNLWVLVPTQGIAYYQFDGSQDATAVKSIDANDWLLSCRNKMIMTSEAADIIEVYSAMGQLLLSGRGDTLDATSLPHGLYIVRAVAEGRPTLTSKIIF